MPCVCGGTIFNVHRIHQSFYMSEAKQYGWIPTKSECHATGIHMYYKRMYEFKVAEKKPLKSRH